MLHLNENYKIIMYEQGNLQNKKQNCKHKNKFLLSNLTQVIRQKNFLLTFKHIPP